MTPTKDVPDPAALIGSRAVINAASGGGKTYALRRILEETHGAMQHLVLDVEDELFTLRERFDYVLIGGEGADAPLAEETAGAMALSLLELGVSAILQLNDVGGLDAQRRIVGAFVAGLMRAPRAHWHPVLVTLDESHRYCPQSAPVPSSEPLINLATAGRKRGFGALFATQRLSALSKDILGQCPNRIMGRVDQALDQRAAAELLGFRPSSEEAKGLMRLRHEFWVVGPAFAPEPRLHRFAPSVTTHLQAGSRDVPTPPTPERVRAMLGRLAELATPPVDAAGTAAGGRGGASEGRRRASGEAAAATKGEADATALAAARAEGVAIGRKQGDLEGYARGIADGGRAALEELRPAVDKMFDGVMAGIALRKQNAPALNSSPSDEGEKMSAEPRPAAVVGAAALAAAGRPGDVPIASGPRFGKPHRRILDALAWFEAAGIAAPTRDQLGWCAGYRADTGHFGNLLSDLVGAGLIERRSGLLALTAAGRVQAQAPAGQVTPAVMVSRIMAKIDAPARKLLDALAKAYPRPMARDALAEATGYRADTGHFGNLIGELTVPGIAVRVGRGELRLEDWVMLKQG